MKGKIIFTLSVVSLVLLAVLIHELWPAPVVKVVEVRKVFPPIEQPIPEEIYLSYELTFRDKIAGLPAFNENQLDVIAESYIAGQPSDKGYTLAAISIVESSAGKYLINVNDISCGNYHNLLKSVNSRLGLRNTSANQNMVCSRLIKDKVFAQNQALAELSFWSKYHKGDWKRMVASYNAGYNTKKGTAYYKKVSRWVKTLRTLNDTSRSTRALDSRFRASH